MVQPDNLKPKMILLVEDDSLSRRAFAQILRAGGYQVAEQKTKPKRWRYLLREPKYLPMKPLIW